MAEERSKEELEKYNKFEKACLIKHTGKFDNSKDEYVRYHCKKCGHELSVYNKSNIDYIGIWLIYLGHSSPLYCYNY